MSKEIEHEIGVNAVWSNNEIKVVRKLGSEAMTKEMAREFLPYLLLLQEELDTLKQEMLEIAGEDVLPPPYPKIWKGHKKCH